MNVISHQSENMRIVITSTQMSHFALTHCTGTNFVITVTNEDAQSCNKLMRDNVGYMSIIC